MLHIVKCKTQILGELNDFVLSHCTIVELYTKIMARELTLNTILTGLGFTRSVWFLMPQALLCDFDW